MFILPSQASERATHVCLVCGAAARVPVCGAAAHVCLVCGAAAHVGLVCDTTVQPEPVLTPLSPSRAKL